MNKFIILTFTGFLLLLSGCGPSGQVEMDQTNIVGDSQPQAWIDAPLNESYLPLDQYEIVYHISGQEGISLGELSINDQVVESLPNPDSSKKLATLKYLWNPTEPGTYLLSVRAQGIDDTWGPEAQSIVYISESAGNISPRLEITDTSNPVSVYSRCDLFDQDVMSLKLLDIPPADDFRLTLYVENPNLWPGIEVQVSNDPDNWVYSAKLSDIQAESCEFFGYVGRLYCIFIIPENMLNSAQELKVRVNKCDGFIFTHPRVSILAPVPVCNSNLGENDCAEAGGEFLRVSDTQNICTCPEP